MSRKTLVLDTECYSNYWLLMFKSVDCWNDMESRSVAWLVLTVA